MTRRAGGILLLGLAVLAAAAGLGKLRFDPDVLSMLPGEMPEVKGLRHYHESFARESELVVLLEGSEEDDGLPGEAAASLAADLLKSEVAAKARWQPQWTDEGEGVSELVAYLWLNGPVDLSEGMRRKYADGRAAEELAAALGRVATAMEGEDLVMRAHDPFGFLEHPSVEFLMRAAQDGGGFESEDGRGHLLLVEAPGPIHGYREAGVWLERVRAVIDSWQERQGRGVAVRLTGEPAFSAEIGGAMERDMSGTVGMTAGLIGLLFWWMQRRLVLLGGLIATLGVVFAATLGIAGWIFGELSIIAAGFAAILIGLTVDYGVLICQEAKLRPGNRTGLLAATGRSIGWAALTTSVVFLALNRSALPGVAQLGTMVACGIGVGAVLMLAGFLPFVARVTRARPVPPTEPRGGGPFPKQRHAFVLVGVIAAVAAGTLGWRGLPGIGFDSAMMRPRDSEAMAAFESVQRHFPAWNTDGLRLVVEGNAEEMAGRLAEAERRLKSRREVIGEAKLPVGWWPDLERQQENSRVLADFAADADRLLAEGDRAGFSEEGLALGRAVFGQLGRMSGREGLIYPESEGAAELLRLFVSRNDDGSGSVVAAVQPAEGVEPAGKDYEALRKLSGGGIWLAGWDLLKPAVQPLVRRDLAQVFLPMAILMIGMLAVIFRSAREVGLILGAMLLSGAVLLTAMSWLGLEWNFLNIAATPLLLGTGIDYGIHVMLALRRNPGELGVVWQGTGKAVVFCGCSTAIGFGSLCFASNEAMASLGAVAVIGVLTAMMISVFLLPAYAAGRVAAGVIPSRRAPGC